MPGGEGARVQEGTGLPLVTASRGQPPESGDPAQPYVSVAETHSGAVFFAGDRAFKLKKPVSFGFLDFSTLEARRRACERELELNRRLAPDVYLDMAALVGSDGTASEHFVVMRRLPADRRLSALVEAGAHVDDHLRALARLLAAFHSRAARSAAIDGWAGRDAVLRRWEANAVEMAAPPRRRVPAGDGGARPLPRSPLPRRSRAAVLRPSRRGKGVRRARGPARRGHLLPGRRPSGARLHRLRRSPALRGRPLRRRVLGHGPRTARAARPLPEVPRALPGIHRRLVAGLPRPPLRRLPGAGAGPGGRDPTGTGGRRVPRGGPPPPGALGDPSRAGPGPARGRRRGSPGRASPPWRPSSPRPSGRPRSAPTRCESR